LPTIFCVFLQKLPVQSQANPLSMQSYNLVRQFQFEKRG
jgi:hypothetical protein